MKRTGVIAKKIGMTSSFDEFGNRLSLTILKFDNCQVVGYKKEDVDGYDALIIGAGVKKDNKVAKPNKHLFSKNNLVPNDILREFRVSKGNILPIGTKLAPSHFIVGNYVDAIGISIGKGFAGVMKRHNFAGLEATHGVSISHRSHGSTGQCQDPGKVFKGKKMAGRMGTQRVTVHNLCVAFVDEENGVLAVMGSVPGAKGSYIMLRDARCASVVAA